MARHSSFLLVASSALFCALLVSRSGAADPPEKRGVITLSDLGGIYYRPAAFLVPFRRVIEGARRSLTACHEIALEEDPKTAAQVDALMHIGPNGEVESASLTAHGTVAEVALACFRRRLVNLIFDPPEGGGATLRVALILGEPPAATRPPLPMLVESQPAMFALGPIPVRLFAAAPAPAVRAIRAATRTLESCATANVPTSAIVVDVRLLVSDTGDVARLGATSISRDGDAIVRCAMKASWPGAHGRLVHVDVRMSVGADGKVSVAP